MAIAIASSPACAHWFIVPLFACGVLCCSDGLLLFSQKRGSLFQPVPLLGAFGVYFFLIAPLLHVATNYWFTSEAWAPKDVPEDWRPWLGIMGVLNLIGLGLYKLLCPPFTRFFLRRLSPTPRCLNPRDSKAYGVILCAITFLLQAYVYYRFGGISGFIRTFGSTRSGEASQFLGLGWLFTLAESFPVLFVILCTALAKRQLRRARPLTLLLYLSASAPLVLLFGGLRGSRGNTIYTMVYILGIIHLTVRPLSRG